MSTRALCVLSLGFCLAACRKTPEESSPPAKVESSSISDVGRKYPALPGLLDQAGIHVLGASFDTTPYAKSDTIHVVLPDSVHLRNWDRFQDFYNEAGNRMGWKGTFTLSDRMQKVRIQFQLDTVGSSGPGLVLKDSTGYFLPPRSKEYAKGSDRIEKTPSDAGMYEDEPSENGSTQGVRCNAVQDINGRLYYNMSAYTFQVYDEETGEGQSASAPPHLVDAITGEHWQLRGNDTWTRKKAGKFRLLRAFPDTNPHDWHVVASNCVDDAYFWQYHPYTRTLERISLETLESAAQEKLPTGIPGNITMIREHGSPGNFNYQALTLARDGDRFTVLRSRGSRMFAQRWDPPRPENTRYVFLSPGSDPSHFSFGDKEYGIDEIEWVDLVAPPTTRHKSAREDAFHSL
ncbi:MAG: hypothetical protein IPN71_22575 [Fibrobacteres bacterium]|nr:hypothetical protein [Fibrobacterota bacterium]